MAARSLNKAQLIGNLTRDPELRYTPQGTAVCTFGLATNRSWTTESGEQREDTQFHRIVSWNKLAEICSKLLFKGRRVFVEGRLNTRQWTTQDGTPRQTTEIIIDDMLILDSKRAPGWEDGAVPEESEVLKEGTPVVVGEPKGAGPKEKGTKETGKKASPAAKPVKKAADQEKAQEKEEKVKAEDIPF